MLSTKGIAHVGIKAHDLVSLSAFYEKTVGLELIERHEGCHIFHIGPGALLEIWGGGTASATRKSPAQQSVRVCFLVDRLEPAITELASRGITPIGEIGSYLGTRWVHYRDIEGNVFGLVDAHAARL